MVTRRSFLAAAAAAPLAGAVGAQTAPAGRMLLAMHQNTSRAAGYRGSLEGWARAGIEYVELNNGLVDAFLEGDTIAAARSILTDNGLTPVSAAAALPDLWLPGPDRDTSLERWRRYCDVFSQLGLEKIYAPAVTNRRLGQEDFDATPAAIRETAGIAAEYGLDTMVEFLRTSTHLATLTTSLQVIRASGAPTMRPMIDFFHFWSGLSKLQDLDLLEEGELAHAHFQDLLDAPRELTNNSYRLIPGDGIAPVVAMLRTLAGKRYDGALSVELFRPEYVNGDPFAVATEIKRKCEAVMREAGVL